MHYKFIVLNDNCQIMIRLYDTHYVYLDKNFALFCEVIINYF